MIWKLLPFLLVLQNSDRDKRKKKQFDKGTAKAIRWFRLATEICYYLFTHKESEESVYRCRNAGHRKLQVFVNKLWKVMVGEILSTEEWIKQYQSWLKQIRKKTNKQEDNRCMKLHRSWGQDTTEKKKKIEQAMKAPKQEDPPWPTIYKLRAVSKASNSKTACSYIVLYT